MIDAASVEAIQRGEYRLVLGEIHPFNTLLQSALISQCPEAHTVFEWLARDCPVPRVLWCAQKQVAPQRVQYHVTPADLAYVSSRDTWAPADVRALRVSDLVVDEEDGALLVQTRDGRLRVPCIEFIGYLMLMKASHLFGVVAPEPHRPRITIDEVVVSREAWTVAAPELHFATATDEADRYLQCRRWADTLGLPQYVFVKMPAERKPTYVDLFSPLFIDLWARSVRTLQQTEPSATITITEMLPTPSGAWVVDAAGNRYTSELRLVAVDPAVVKALGVSRSRPPRS
jgi:hypothetical protein